MNTLRTWKGNRDFHTAKLPGDSGSWKCPPWLGGSSHFVLFRCTAFRTNVCVLGSEDWLGLEMLMNGKSVDSSDAVALVLYLESLGYLWRICQCSTIMACKKILPAPSAPLSTSGFAAKRQKFMPSFCFDIFDGEAYKTASSSVATLVASEKGPSGTLYYIFPRHFDHLASRATTYD